MTVQKAIFGNNRHGGARFIGVLRAGIVSAALDRLGIAPPAGDPHRLFLCDANGRLVTRLAPEDPYVVEAPLAVADTEQAVLAPPVGAAAGVVVREVVPACPVRRVVLAHGAPLPLRQVGAEALPVALAGLVFLQPVQFGSGGTSISVPHAVLTPIAAPGYTRNQAN